MDLKLFTQSMFVGPESPNSSFPFNFSRMTTLYIETGTNSFSNNNNVSSSGNSSNMVAANDLTTTHSSNNGSNGSDSDILAPIFFPIWQQAIFYALFIVIFIVAAGGNIIVIWIVLAHKRMRTVTNYFLVNLAVADVCIAVFNVLFHFTVNLYQTWFFGLGYCKFSYFLATCAISVSVLTFMAIAVDRYIAIIYPLRPRLTGRVVIAIITGIWWVSCLLALPNLIYSATFTTKQGRIICYLEWENNTQTNPSQRELAYNILVMIFNFFLPMITLTVTYMRIGWELWGSKAIGETMAVQNERMKSKRKVVKMMITVVVIFILCWLPTHTYFIVSAIPSIRNKLVFWPHMHIVYIFIYWLAMSNSMYNPIVYCLMNARFRHGFLKFFRWCPCKPCRQRHNLLLMERVHYSTRMGSGRSDKNGSLLHTTLDTMDDHVTTPNSATYRMHPMKSRSAGNNCAMSGNSGIGGGGGGGGGYNTKRAV